MKETILSILAIITLRDGMPAVISILQAKGDVAFNNFFSTLFTNSIEAKDEMDKKTELYGMSKMLMGVQAFYNPPYSLVGKAVLTMVKTVCYDVSKQDRLEIGGKQLGELNVEYNAYHKLSLTKIGIEDPAPQVTDLKAMVKETLHFINNVVPGGVDAVVSSLPEADREYLQRRLLSLYHVCENQTIKND